MNKTLRAATSLTPLVTIVILAYWLIVLAVNAPGQLSYDSVVQLWEGRTGDYRSMHPPIMSALLGLFDRALSGTVLYVVFASGLFIVALLIVVKRGIASDARSRLLCVVFGLLLLNPMMVVYQGTVWKDVLFANIVALSFSLLTFSSKIQPSMKGMVFLVAAAVLSGFAVLVRQQGLIVAVGVAATASFVMPKSTTSFQRVLISVTCILIALSTAVSTTYLIRKTSSGGLPDTTEMGLRILRSYDILGMIVHGTPIPEDSHLSLEGRQAVESYAAKIYTAARVDPVTSEIAPDAWIDLSSTEVQKIWSSMIIAHPANYVAHRVNVFRWQIFPRDIFQCLPIHVGVSGPAKLIAELGLTEGQRASDQSLYRYARALFHTPLFSGLAWALASFSIALYILLRRFPEPGHVAVFGLQITSLAYLGSYFFVGIACDFRYVFLVPVSVCVGLACLISSSRAGSRSLVEK